MVAPKPMWDAGSATTRQIHYMGGSLTTPTAPQRTDVNPNRCGEPVNPLKGTLAPLERGGGQTLIYPPTIILEYFIEASTVDHYAWRNEL